MLTAANEQTKMVQEVMATTRGELMSTERPAQVAFVDSSNPMPTTGACRLLGAVLFAGEYSNANLRIMDAGRSSPILEVFASAGWWGNFVMSRGVASTGNLVVDLIGMGAYGYVYYIPE